MLRVLVAAGLVVATGLTVELNTGLGNLLPINFPTPLAGQTVVPVEVGSWKLEVGPSEGETLEVLYAVPTNARCNTAEVELLTSNVQLLTSNF